MLEFFLVIILFCGQNFAARNTITPDWRMVPMAGNEIVKNETVELDDEQGGTIIAINLALDIHDLSQAEPFVAEVAEAFLMQRMVSPPETSGLLITIVGKMQPDEFATFWSLATADNEPLQVFMSQMVFADVVGKMRDREPDEMFGVSLLQQ